MSILSGESWEVIEVLPAELSFAIKEATFTLYADITDANMQNILSAITSGTYAPIISIRKENLLISYKKICYY